MPASLSQPPRARQISSTQLVLREAKRLHRAATTNSPAEALPVLRRLLAASVVTAATLPSLFRARATVQRKHVLQALAREAGYRCWEDYRRELPLLDPEQVRQVASLQRGTSTLKLWFPDEPEAMRFAAEHGGHAVRIGRQAVVLPSVQREVGPLRGL
ncbi:MAG: hypothetical protein JNN03_15745 [Rubrivivax sp.]|nr:hypothetical protein [Rubrivivax sp.]